MDAIVYLRKEHSNFRKSLKEISKISDENKKLKRFNDLAQALTRHEKMEEQVWYPILRQHKDLRDIIKHLISEEKSAAKAITSLKKTKYRLIWNLKFLKLKYDVDHHASEEEDELFTKVRKYLSKAELNQIGTQMNKFEATY